MDSSSLSTSALTTPLLLPSVSAASTSHGTGEDMPVVEFPDAEHGFLVMWYLPIKKHVPSVPYRFAEEYDANVTRVLLAVYNALDAIETQYWGLIVSIASAPKHVPIKKFFAANNLNTENFIPFDYWYSYKIQCPMEDLVEAIEDGSTWCARVSATVKDMLTDVAAYSETAARTRYLYKGENGYRIHNFGPHLLHLQRALADFLAYIQGDPADRKDVTHVYDSQTYRFV